MDAPHRLLLLPFLTLTTSALLPWLHLSFISPPLLVHAQYYSNDPSATNWTLSDFYQYYNYSDYRYILSEYSRYNNYVICNNYSSSLSLLSDEEGLYGRSTGIVSGHWYMPYTAYFALYFVIPAQSVCLKGNNSSAPAYYLSLVARNWYGNDLNRAKVLWTANIDKPVSENACLHLEEDSNFKLVEYGNTTDNTSNVVWETDTTNKAVNASLAFTFEGNLVLFSNTTDPPFVPLWQSHQHPTNSLRVLQVLEKSSILSVNSSSPNLGNYTMAIQDGGLVLYVRVGQNSRDPSPYLSPYWAWPNASIARGSGALANNNEFAVLCWDPVNQLRLYVGSNRSGNSFEISSEFCSSIPTDETAMRIAVDADHGQGGNVTFATFLRLDQDGDLRVYTVDNTTYPDYNSDSTSYLWSNLYSAFNDTPCQLPLYCGFYGICDQEQKSESGRYNCTCDAEFEEFESAEKGCSKLKSNSSGDRKYLWDRKQQYPNNSFTCQNNSACSTNGSICNTEFLKINNITYFSLKFDDYEPVQYNNTAQPDQICTKKCEEECNCSAVFWDGNASSCYLIRGQVGTIQKGGNMVAFVKYINIHINSKPPRKPLSWKMIGPVLAAALLVTCIVLVFIYKRRRDYKMTELENERLLLSLLDSGSTERFTWKQIHEYTCGFSDLLGVGGFGSVFRGSLPDATAIAVKQLEEDRSHQGQGNREFVAEVSILSRIHHAHLVRLIGFCLEGAHRLLVYEYMENGSLDAWIFKSPTIELEHHGELHYTMEEKNSSRQRDMLPWKKRFQIALGTAKGLAYLHEECEERVIHMDLKPQNILLGGNFLAKISDFGMSRRTNREQTSVMTVMRGTPGYLAPEWLMDCAITEKCDVYSFGIVLLEMVSGRKVKDLRGLKQKLRMRPLRESVIVEFLNEELRHYDTAPKEKEAVRMVEIALLCVQRDPMKRPAMSSVVLMLEGKGELLQAAYLVDDDDEDGQQLVTYPSRKNKTMRSMPRNSDSFTSHAGGSSNVWSSNSSNWMANTYSFSIDRVNNRRQTELSTSFYQSGEDDSTEYDHLLNR